MATAERLRLENIVKEYPGCRANDGVHLSVQAGEIHALLGENGAGKSTLMKIIYGVIQPDAGTLTWNGHPLTLQGPAHARELGIGMVFQHFSLFETLTVAENIALSLPAAQARDRSKLDTRIREVSEHYGMALDPRRFVNTLSIGERQRVEIVRCLIQDSSLLILDEPTSVLTPQEVQVLFRTLRQLSKEGCSILFISHKLQEVRDLCHRATVLRQGRVTGECNPGEITTDDIARMMVGNETPLSTQVDPSEPGELLLQTNNLNYQTRDPFGTSLQDICMSLRAGEIVGIAGVAGNGQDELLRALSGEAKVNNDSLQLSGMSIGDSGPAVRRKLGVAVVPEERLGRGAVPSMSLVDNSLLTAYGQGMISKGWVGLGKVRDYAGRVVEQFGVRAAGIDSAATSLSGGNLQKFIIGREALQQPKLLVASHPTWGVDVGSAVAIHEALVKLRDEGAAVLLISEDLDELFQLCGRMGAICAGKLSPLVPTSELSIEKLGQWMAGDFPTAATNTTTETKHAVA
ncbi:ABC transporter ATP-binding protein [Pseudomonas neustonica]|uniref:ABC transporter ATP-binding protein n=1 Tax=Pseudomonas neustonica TaxID=2487346 RepID=A0ABX9XJX1_9PSED|nr:MULTISPECIES: ABC transporter ATP-binding protein [Pseudomonas]MAB22793.1 ABC transporter [Pseudomonadales bacterium]MBA6420255.1 ABC transporter ATP-binding protein [Pseudomonas sp. 5Ae-yellow]ROZ84623.1 ABC transporter ATP-binding protein [Pseudomonas sp. SSM44]ROZ86427.1 ABC transporter ATP-binding protein [Pseudomonas neustonica]|tara:strand:- start:362 stop:1915 length:1554 start_codon:yes stop_codon:yes gene_type:complete